MRVNVESDLWASGRLGAFARALGVGEREAIGVLVYVWHETQHRELMLVTEAAFASAIAIRLGDLDPAKVFAAMIKAQLISHVEGETWLIRGNDEHVARLRQLRSSASNGGKASVEARGKLKLKPTVKHMVNHTVEHKVERMVEHKLTSPEPRPNLAGTLPTPYSQDHDLDPDLTAPSKSAASRSSSLSSDAKNELALTAPPSATAVAEKRKQRSVEQKARGVECNRRYRELYEQAEGYQPPGLDAAFNGMMARFADKYADDAIAILEWAFQTPDAIFKRSGWKLQLIIDRAAALYRELKNPRRAVENIAAPKQQQQMALAASNDLAFEEYQRRKAERLANANQV